MTDADFAERPQQDPLPIEVQDDWGEPVRENWQDRTEDDEFDDSDFDEDTSADSAEEVAAAPLDDPDAIPDEQQAWAPGATGPVGTGTEGADQALADDFADPSESIVDDRKPMRDVYATEDTAAAEQGNREGDETLLETDTPSQGFAPTDENWAHQAEREADRHPG